MKLIKPLNQFRASLQRAVSSGGHRFLSLIMAVLLFCTANRQAVAASMPIGANVAADRSAPITSEDKFNAADLLQDSAPSPDDSPSLTFTQKLELAGAALLLLGGGGAYAWKAGYLHRLGRGEEKNRAELNNNLDQLRKRTGSSDENTLNPNDSAEQERTDIGKIDIQPDNGSSTAAGEDAPTSKWESFKTALASFHQGLWRLLPFENSPALNSPELVAQALDSTSNPLAEVAPTSKWESCKTALTSFGQAGWDLLTLKACRGVVTDIVPDKSFLELLTELHTAHQTQKVALQKANRTVLQLASDLWNLKGYKVPDTRTARQQELVEVAALKDKPQAQLSNNQMTKILEHATREKRFNLITVKSSLEQMYAALDPEMKKAIEESLPKYSSFGGGYENPEEQKRHFLYFVVKNHDKLTPGMLESLNDVFESANRKSDEVDDHDSKTIEANKNLVAKLDNEIEKLWNEDSEKNREQEIFSTSLKN